MKKKLRFSYEEKLLESIDNQFGELPTWNELGHGRDLVESQKRGFLADAILITPGLLPEVYDAYQDCLQTVGCCSDGDLFVMQSQEMNASVCAHDGRFNMLVHSSLIEKLTIEELRFVFGHELGHVVFGHSVYPLRVILEAISDECEEAVRLLLRWSCACEISADRMGLLCCGSMTKAISALFCISSGLAGIDEDRILATFRGQYQALMKHIDGVEVAKIGARTHPMMPIRFKALELSALDILLLRNEPNAFSWRNFEKFEIQISNLIESIDMKMQ